MKGCVNGSSQQITVSENKKSPHLESETKEEVIVIEVEGNAADDGRKEEQVDDSKVSVEVTFTLITIFFSIK